MKIVIEYVLLENLALNLIVLKTTSLVLKEKGRLFLLSAFLCACFTVALPAFNLATVGSFLVQIGLAILSVCISFKFKTLKKFAQLLSCYFLSAFIYGGACYFFEGLFGIISLLVVLAVAVTVFAVVAFLSRKVHRKRAVENFCFDVEIETGGQKTKWKAFLDSGNLLFDPLTESPVTLVNYRVFSSIFKDIDLEDVLRRSDKLKSLKFAHYISLNTLGRGDKILVFQVDKIFVNEKVLEKPILGLSLRNFNAAFNSDIILHNNFALASG